MSTLIPEEFWKYATWTLLSVLATGLTSWFAWGVSTASLHDLEKVEKRVETNQQTLTGLRVILSRIESNQDHIKELVTKHQNNDPP